MVSSLTLDHQDLMMDIGYYANTPFGNYADSSIGNHTELFLQTRDFQNIMKFEDFLLSNPLYDYRKKTCILHILLTYLPDLSSLEPVS